MYLVVSFSLHLLTVMKIKMGKIPDLATMNKMNSLERRSGLIFKKTSKSFPITVRCNHSMLRFESLFIHKLFKLHEALGRVMAIYYLSQHF